MSARVAVSAAGEQLDPAERLVADHGAEGVGLGDVPALGQHRGLRVVGGVGESFPLVEQAGVDLAHDFAQPVGQVVELVGLGRFGHVLHEPLVGVAQVAQQHALGPLEPVVVDVLAERHGPLPQLSGDGLGAHGVVADPRLMLAEDVEGRIEEVGEWLRGSRAASSFSMRSSYSTPADLSPVTSSAPKLVELGRHDHAR